MTYKDYKVNSHNSTVCGYAGRGFDWSKFDWNQETSHDFDNQRYSKTSEFVPKESRGQLIGIQKAPAVFIDTGFIGAKNEYLHVPYNYIEDGTIYRVRPNESMQAGEMYRGKIVKRTKAIKKDDGWYWRIIWEDTK
jgi:hypothetical protein